MLISVIPDFTRTMGKNQPEYQTLRIRDETFSDGTPCMSAQWEFTPAEIEAVQRGAPFMLSMLGTSWTPVLPWIGASPDPVAHTIDLPGRPGRVTLKQAAAALQRDGEGRGRASDAAWLAQTFRNACTATGVDTQKTYRFLRNFIVGLQTGS